MIGFLFRLLLGVLIVLSVAAHATAASPQERLDAIASSVAGKPASVVCTINAEEWDARVQEVSKGTRRGTSAGGFAYAGTSTLFLGPHACITLKQVFEGGVVYAGLNPTAFALLTLLHEAVHLRGVVDEGETECIALRAFQSYLDDIGVPATVRKAVNVKGRYTLRSVSNPHIRLLSTYAQRHHDQRPLEYRGNC